MRPSGFEPRSSSLPLGQKPHSGSPCSSTCYRHPKAPRDLLILIPTQLPDQGRLGVPDPRDLSDSFVPDLPPGGVQDHLDPTDNILEGDPRLPAPIQDNKHFYSSLSFLRSASDVRSSRPSLVFSAPGSCLLELLRPCAGLHDWIWSRNSPMLWPSSTGLSLLLFTSLFILYSL